MSSRALGLFGLVLLGCASSEKSAATTTAPYVFETPEFSVQPGEEKYLCYAKTLEQDLAIDRFETKGRAGIHHSIFARTTAPEPDGFSECKVLLRTTWVPAFVNATGDAALELPQGVGVVLPKGTQILVQLHLLNAGKSPLTSKYALSMRKSTAQNPDPVGIYAFGTLSLEVPPKLTSEQVDRCTNPADLDVFAVLPHMHTMGKALKFEAGPSDDKLAEIYRNDAFNFDQQVIVPKAFKLPAGTRTKVSCTFDNTTESTLKFGESTNDEMCFLLTFARNREGLSGCDGKPSGSTSTNPECGTKPANELGIGQKCTKGGKECPSGMMCTLDQSSTPPESPGFCFKLGCDATADCGTRATCCAPKQAGGLVKVCMPDECRPSDCEVAK